MTIKFLVLNLALFTMSANNLYGQIKLSGTVESELKEPLAFSTLSFKNSSVGTIANIQGRFVLFVPASSLNDTLVISMMGYHSQEILVSRLKNSQSSLFVLKEKPVELEEVVIISGELSAEELLRLAVKKQKDNTPDSKYALDLFVRELFFFDDSCYAVVESAAQLFGQRILTPNFPIYLDQIRSAVGSEPTVPTVFKRYNPFREFRYIIGKRFRFHEPCTDCFYEIEGYTFVDDQQAAIISTKKDSGEPNPSFKFVIGLSDYGIYRSEFNREIPFGLGFPKQQDSVASSLVSLNRTIDFTKFEGKYYLKSYRQSAQHNYLNLKDSSRYNTKHTFNVLANSITKDGVDSLRKSKNQDHLMNYRFSFLSQSKGTDPEFWKNYNIIRRTEEETNYYEALSTH